jgi:mono/diheme cytochrome c family protein
MNLRLIALMLVLITGMVLEGCHEKQVSATTDPQTAGSPESGGSPESAASPENAGPESSITPETAGSPEMPGSSETSSSQDTVGSPSSPGAAGESTPGAGGTSKQAVNFHKYYDTEPSWSDPQRLIPLNYQQAQGKRIFYNTCVWCHADVTPAGPSNRSNVSPTPPLINDGATLNQISDEYLQNIITLGGSAMGKSTMMPPWGQTLRQDDIQAVIAYIRAVAEPPYEAPARPASQYMVK